MFSGHTALANTITEVANYAYVPQMTFPELVDWAAQSGLSKEELALIQPGYWYTLGDILSVVFSAWALGLMAILINAWQIARRGKEIVTPIISLVVVIPLLYVGYLCVE